MEFSSIGEPVYRPTLEVITLDEAKKQCVVDHTQYDTQFSVWTSDAREYVENILGQSLGQYTYDVGYDRFPCSSAEWMYLPRPPVTSVTSVKYYDTADTEYTWSSAEYQVDLSHFPPRILPKDGFSWPSTVLRPLRGVVVRMVAGYAKENTFALNGSDRSLFECVGHGLQVGDSLLLGLGQGLAASTLPTGLSEDTRYWVRQKSADQFRVATSKTGAIVTPTTAGTGASFVWAKGIPTLLQNAVRLRVAQHYENREAVTDMKMQELPLGLMRTLRMRRLRYF